MPTCHPGPRSGRASPNNLFQKCKENGGDDEQERNDVIPLERFRVEHRHGNRCEHRKRNGFLNDLQLHQAERTAIDATADAVCGNHKAVFKEGKAPRSENHKNQRPVGADVHFFELEVAVPSERHKDVGTAEKKNCKNTSFHNLVISQWLLVVSVLSLGLAPSSYFWARNLYGLPVVIW